jgi:WD40 repeat protein
MVGNEQISPESTQKTAVIQPAVPSQEKSPTSSPMVQSTPTLTEQAFATISPTQTSTPLPTLSRFEIERPVINASNFSEIEVHETLGKGHVVQSDMSDDGKYQIVKTLRGIYIYETETLNERAFLEGHRDFYVRPGKPQIVAISPELTLQVVDLETMDVIVELIPENAQDIGLLTFSKDANLIAVTVSQPHATRLDFTSYRIDIWDLEKGKFVGKLESDLFGVCTALGFSDLGQQLITECYPSGSWRFTKLVHWDIPSLTATWYLSNDGHFTHFPFSPDGSLVAFYTYKNQLPYEVIIRRTLDGAEVSRVYGMVSDFAFSPDNEMILTSSNSQIWVWHIRSAQLMEKIETGLEWPEASFSENGDYILANGGELAWRASDYSPDPSYIVSGQKEPQAEISSSVWRQLGHLDGILVAQRLSNGQLFVWGFSENQFLWWWLPDQQIFEEISVGAGWGEPVFSPLEENFAVCTEEGLKIINVATNEVTTHDGCRSEQTYLAFSGDGKRLFMSYGTLIDEVDIESGISLRQLRGHTTIVGGIEISKDGKYLFSASLDEIRGGHEVAIWGLDPNKLIRKWILPTSTFSRFVDGKFTLDNANMVSIFNNTLTVWRVVDGWYLANLDGTALALSPDGEVAIISSPEMVLHLYSLDDWSLVDTVDVEKSHLSGIKFMDFLNQGKILVSISYGDVVHLWGVE